MSVLRGAIIGAGGMGKRWAPVLASNTEVSFVVWIDIDRSKAEAGVSDLGLTGVATEGDLLTALDRFGLNFVIDVTLPEQHHDITVACLEHKVAVLGEKPLAATMAEALDLVRTAEETKTLFAVSQCFRYNSGLVAFKELMEEIGGASHVNVEFYRGLHAPGFREEMESPLLLDMAVHTFDAARYIIGVEPLSVYCTEFNPPRSWYRGDACASADFEFENGARLTYQGSWCAQGFETSWESSWRGSCALGSAAWDGTSWPVAEDVASSAKGRVGKRVEAPRQSRMAGDRFYSRSDGGGDGLEASLADFVRALRTGSGPMTECHDNLRSFAMVMAAMDSSRTGRRVEVVP